MPSSDADPISRVLATVRATIINSRLSREQGRCLVGVSGGADSTCLLDVLVTLFGRGSPVAVHVDHGFRPDSARDADHVTALAGRLGVHCDVIKVDGPAFADEHSLGLEAAGRILRHRAFWEAGRRHGRVVTTTGHTRDDSVESLLLHLIRGSGLDGLGGIAFRELFDLHPTGASPAGRPGEVVNLFVERPLLRVSRADTGAYCQARGLDWVVDPINDDPRHLRNRVRHHLLPVLRTYNPSVDAVLERTARLLHDERRLLRSHVAARWHEFGMVQDGVAVLDAHRLSRHVIPLRRRLIRYAVELAGGHGDTLTFDAVERAIAVAAPDGPPRAQLGGGIVAVRNGDKLEIRREGVEPT